MTKNQSLGTKVESVAKPQKDNNLNITGFLVLVTVPRKRAMKEKVEFSATCLWTIQLGISVSISV